jgi:hypothetical protein
MGAEWAATTSNIVVLRPRLSTLDYPVSVGLVKWIIYGTDLADLVGVVLRASL